MLTDHGMSLATALVEMVGRQRVILPPIDVLERVCAGACGTRRVYEALVSPLTTNQEAALDQLLDQRDSTTPSTLT